jgi:uncharacterized protein
MEINKTDLTAILVRFNPWWTGETVKNLPEWKRAVFNELFRWIFTPPAPRAVFLSGARQVGKTTLLRQSIKALLEEGIPAANILYVTFDHPIIKMVGVEKVIQAWIEREPAASGPRYLFLDEVQFIADWQVWVKHQVDFNPERRIIFTGSAVPLVDKGQESGVGRWHTIRLTTLSFFENLRLKKSILENYVQEEFGKNSLSDLNYRGHLSRGTMGVEKINEIKSLNNLISLPEIKSLKNLFDFSQNELQKISETATSYIPYFNQYLIRGGFPQTVQVESISEAQSLIREDIIDKVLKRDMTALFGVRKFIELEQVFIYLCMNDGGILKLEDLAANLNVSRTTALHFIELLEATHLIYRLQKFGYGKDVLRARFKVYLADPAIAPSILLMGNSVLENASAMGKVVETAVFKHLFTHAEPGSSLSYWQDEKNHEVDLVTMRSDNTMIPFEIKYRNNHTRIGDLHGLMKLCKKYSAKRAYVVTQSITDFGPFENPDLPETRFMKIPAALLCYWLGQFESEHNGPTEIKLF